MCAECEPQVVARVEQARYTAKTDHLRRMMERSRVNRGTQGRGTWVGGLEWAGRRAWWAGLGGQLVWHWECLFRVAEEVAQEGNGEGVFSVVVRVLGMMGEYFPGPETVIAWSTAASILSAWWNPFFLQYQRGFSRPLLGLSNWYAMQAFIVVARVMSSHLLSRQQELQLDVGALVTAHLASAAITILVSFPCEQWTF